VRLFVRFFFVHFFFSSRNTCGGRWCTGSGRLHHLLRAGLAPHDKLAFTLVARCSAFVEAASVVACARVEHALARDHGHAERASAHRVLEYLGSSHALKQDRTPGSHAQLGEGLCQLVVPAELAVVVVHTMRAREGACHVGRLAEEVQLVQHKAAQLLEVVFFGFANGRTWIGELDFDPHTGEHCVDDVATE